MSLVLFFVVVGTYKIEAYSDLYSSLDAALKTGYRLIGAYVFYSTTSRNCPMWHVNDIAINLIQLFWDLIAWQVSGVVAVGVGKTMNNIGASFRGLLTIPGHFKMTFTTTLNLYFECNTCRDRTSSHTPNTIYQIHVILTDAIFLAISHEFSAVATICGTKAIHTNQ